MSSRKALDSDHAAISKEVVIAISQTQPKEKRCSEYASRIKKLGVDLEEPMLKMLSSRIQVGKDRLVLSYALRPQISSPRTNSQTASSAAQTGPTQVSRCSVLDLQLLVYEALSY